jgi:hypothetical protein
MAARSQLPHKRLGATGMDVSVLAFGGAVIGIEGYLQPAGDTSEDGIATALRTAVERGITLYDTAPGYGAGRSEELIGRTLEPYRDSIKISTKIGLRPDGDPGAWSDSVRSSLERLRTDHVDLLQVHGNTWTEENSGWLLGTPLEWLESMRDQGLARAIGITAEAPSGALELLLRTRRFDVLQIAYSVIYQDPCDYQRAPFGVIPLARSLGMGVLTMRTTTSGVFQRLLHSEFPELDGTRLSRLAIKFVLSTPEVDCALVGMSHAAEVEENCALAADESDRLDLVKLHDFFGNWPDARVAAR